jgi:hypothetical protein
MEGVFCKGIANYDLQKAPKNARKAIFVHHKIEGVLPKRSLDRIVKPFCRLSGKKKKSTP